MLRDATGAGGQQYHEDDELERFLHHGRIDTIVKGQFCNSSRSRCNGEVSFNMNYLNKQIDLTE